jgi:rare lipoprotein A
VEGRLRSTAITWIGAGFLLTLAGCAARQPQPNVPPIATVPGYGQTVIGTASWYGPGFDGHRTASGEIYDERQLTAATDAYRLGSRVMVTNLDNGRSVEVAINDRGPFVKGRIVDLSYGAARALGMIGPGTARVRMQLVSAPRSSLARGYYVQVGSFSNATGAQRVRDNIARRYSDVSISEVDIGNHRYFRVRMGAFQTREAAIARARSAASLDLPIIIVSE